ncbi:MAG: hypothetical protein KDB00_08555 [Planctomycetales bacterium]|nr:hypothetical protein [Planctomycetales bacterium]
MTTESSRPICRTNRGDPIPPNIAILHCHFRRGGVTQVVENHVASLREKVAGKIVLISGGRNDGLSDRTLDQTTQLIVEGIDYDTVVLGRDPMDEDFAGLAERAERLVTQIVGGLDSLGLSIQDTVLHWHNHSLGKNVAAPQVIKLLASRHGARQVLQIHDFAEDLRCENYSNLLKGVRTLYCDTGKRFLTPLLVNRYCYPDISGVHYVTLTRGDADVLARLGIDSGRVHLLPNSVTLGNRQLPDQSTSLHAIRRAASLPGDARWCLYPVRGIRRKNVGEFLLLSRMLPESMYAGITLPPTTEIEFQSYRRWKELGSIVAPQAVFDAGTFADVSFIENLSAADFVLSTSVAEGFGMAYLEPWLAHRGVVARRLPNVVDDFTRSGVCLDRFYDRVEIPGAPGWINECVLESRHAFQKAWEPLTEITAQPWRIEHRTTNCDDRRIDFAVLTPKRQIEVLRRISRDKGFENEVMDLNSRLVGWLANPFDEQTLRDNEQLIATDYSLAAAAERLAKIYNDVLREPVSATSGKLTTKHDRPPKSDSAPQDSVIDLVFRHRAYYPCRTETEIAR